jgi:hypothetical protein
MCYGIVGSDLVVRMTAAEFARVRYLRHVRPMYFTGPRP